MATINRKRITVKLPPRSYTEDGASKYYNTIAWRRLRKVYKTEHPICTICLKHGKVEPMVDIHHIHPFMQGKTEEDRWDMFLKESNLIPLCEACHHGVHKKIDTYHLDFCDDLTESEWREAHDEMM